MTLQRRGNGFALVGNANEIRRHLNIQVYAWEKTQKEAEGTMALVAKDELASLRGMLSQLDALTTDPVAVPVEGD